MIPILQAHIEDAIKEAKELRETPQRESLIRFLEQALATFHAHQAHMQVKAAESWPPRART